MKNTPDPMTGTPVTGAGVGSKDLQALQAISADKRMPT